MNHLRPDKNRSARTTNLVSRDRQTLLPPALEVEGSNEGVFRLTAKGVFASDGTFLCPPLKIVACTRTRESEDWGLLLEWEDALMESIIGFPSRSELLAGDGMEIRQILWWSAENRSPRFSAQHLITGLPSGVKEAAAACDRDITPRLAWPGVRSSRHFDSRGR